MTSIIKHFLVAIIMSVLVVNGTMFAASTAQNIDLNNNTSINNADDESTLAGVWRGTVQIPQLNANCQTEYVFQPNYKYSSTMVCGSMRVWQTGDWRIVQPGILRLDIVNYEPKEYAGRKIYMPDGETLSYRFINSGQLRLISTIVIEGVTGSDLYRVQ